MGLALALALCTVLAPPLPASADELPSHRRAALEFYHELRADDSRPVVTAVTDLVLQLAPNLAAHRDVIEDFVVEAIESEAYENALTDVYVDLFDEEELRTLTWLFRHETFRRYRDQRVEIIRRSSQATATLFRTMLPRLQQRIREEGAGHARE